MTQRRDAGTWVAVAERLPEEPTGGWPYPRVICAFSDGSVLDGDWRGARRRKRRDDSGFQFGGGDWDASFPAPKYRRRGLGYCEEGPWVYVTHWMPMPKHPHREAA